MGKFKMRKPNPKGLKSPMRAEEKHKPNIPIVPPADLKPKTSDFSFDASLLPSKPIHAAESTGTGPHDIDTIVNLERAMKEEDDKHIAILPDGTKMDTRDRKQDAIRPGWNESLQHFKGNIIRGY